jgi:O-acetyl-ADP-ribose deacetylase (regulator of RNase III)
LNYLSDERNLAVLFRPVKGLTTWAKTKFDYQIIASAIVVGADVIYTDDEDIHRALIGKRFIIHFPTKQHWRGNSKYEYIQSGLKALVSEVQICKIRSIALPPLGCGLGNLE